jgi:hypothetical protein
MTTESNKGLSRRSVLLQGVVCAAGAATILTAAADPAMAAKLPKAAVGYQEKPHGSQKCSNCALFQKPHSCKSVAGTISPNGWCRIYRKA